MDRLTRLGHRVDAEVERWPFMNFGGWLMRAFIFRFRLGLSGIDCINRRGVISLIERNRIELKVLLFCLVFLVAEKLCWGEKYYL